MRSRVERTDLGERMDAHGAVPVRRAIERVVVDDDRHAVRGPLNVEFDRVDAAALSRDERCQSVLWREGKRATVADDAQRSAATQVRACYARHVTRMPAFHVEVGP